ncbi:MAG: acyl-CoA dehydrogenase family protein [Proteobacteria bacterium]|nr:acyl-CoA dehydrogenase family protein [Pseudomonadota bacterium]
MNFDLTEEQRMLQDTVRRYLNDKIAPLADEYDRKGPLTKADAHRFLKELKPFGYVGTLVPEDLGGPGLTHIDWALLHEPLRGAWAGLGGTVGITSAGTYGVSHFENTALRDRILPGLLDGDKIICTAITEPNVGSDARNIETRAVLDGDHYVLNGTKMWISNGTIADYVTVVATTDRSKGAGGVMHLLVERDVSPFESREIHKMGVRSFPTAELIFDDCRVPRENVVREPGQGLKQTLTGLTFARANAAIASVGIAQAALDVAVRYAKERVQFGKPIGQHQLVQEMFADMAADIDAARLLAWRAFYLMDQGHVCFKESSIAKAFATEMAVRATSNALQIHGAYGLSEEYQVERFFRDARCYTIPDGTTQIQKLIIGREILGMSAFR